MTLSLSRLDVVKQTHLALLVGCFAVFSNILVINLLDLSELSITSESRLSVSNGAILPLAHACFANLNILGEWLISRFVYHSHLVSSLCLQTTR